MLYQKQNGMDDMIMKSKLVFRVFMVASFIGAMLLLTSCLGKKEFVPDGVHCKINKHCAAGKVCKQGLCKLAEPVGETPAQKAKRLIKEADAAIAAEVPNCEVALKKMGTAIKIIPEYNTPEVQYNMGLCMLKGEQFDEAEEIFQALYKQFPENEAYVMGLGRIMATRREFKKALTMYDEFLKRKPRSIDVRANFATMLRINKQNDDALFQCREVFIQDPSHPGAFNNMALIFYDQGKVGLAKMVLYNGIEAQKNVRKVEDPSLYVNLGVINMDQGDFLGALASFKRARDIDRNNLGANLNLGNIALQNFDYPFAEECYNSALIWDPANVDAKFGLAIAYRGNGKLDESEKMYLDLLKKDPKNPKLLWNLLVLYYDFKKDKKKSDPIVKRFLKTKYGTKEQRQRAEIYLQEEPMVEEERAPEQEWVNPVICVQCKTACPTVKPCPNPEECEPLAPELQKCAPCQKCPTEEMCTACKDIDCTPKECTDDNCPPPPPECPTCAICDGIKEIQCQIDPDSCKEAPAEGEEAPAEGEAAKDDKGAKKEAPKAKAAPVKKVEPKKEAPKAKPAPKAEPKKEAPKAEPKKEAPKKAEPKKDAVKKEAAKPEKAAAPAKQEKKAEPAKAEKKPEKKAEKKAEPKKEAEKKAAAAPESAKK